jgi:hypothetical protein
MCMCTSAGVTVFTCSICVGATPGSNGCESAEASVCALCICARVRVRVLV